MEHRADVGDCTQESLIRDNAEISEQCRKNGVEYTLIDETYQVDIEGGCGMNIICFGDSNTYGYDPRSWMGGRYDADSRWVDILVSKTGWTVQNMGVNGREIPLTAPDMPTDTDLLIVMLGSNDLLQGCSPVRMIFLDI